MRQFNAAMILVWVFMFFWCLRDGAKALLDENGGRLLWEICLAVWAWYMTEEHFRYWKLLYEKEMLSQ